MKGKFRTRINLKLEGVENLVDPKSIPIKVWFVGKVCKMRKKTWYLLVECMDTIDLVDCSSNMHIGLCWYQEGQ